MSSETATGQECKVHVDINLVFDKASWFYTPFHSPLILFIYFTWTHSLHLLIFFHGDKIISQMQLNEEADYLTPNPWLQNFFHVEVKAWTWKPKGIVIHTIKKREKWVPLSHLYRPEPKPSKWAYPLWFGFFHIN